MGTSVRQESFEMEHQLEHKQKQALVMARHVTNLQQSLESELLSMDDTERDEILQKCQSFQEEFVSKANNFPRGIGRINYIQGLSMEKQKWLIMWKIWERVKKRRNIK